MKISFILKIILFTILSIAVYNDVWSQSVKIKSIQVEAEGRVKIKYDLFFYNQNHLFTIKLYIIGDNLYESLKMVSGEVGPNIKPGVDKIIIWDSKELKNPVDRIQFEIEVFDYVPFIKIDDFGLTDIIKKGKPFDIHWYGGRPDNILVFELYRKDKIVFRFPEKPNLGTARLTVPRNIKPGVYHLKITDYYHKDEIVETGDFKIRNKIPIQIMLIGGGILATGIYRFLTKDTSVNQLPLPPNPAK